MKYVLLFFLFSAFLLAQAPTTYPTARIDKAVTQLPNPMPDWGGAIGAGKKWCNPAYNGDCYYRLSDANTAYPAKPHYTSMQTGDSGLPRFVNKTGSHVVLRTTGGSTVIVGFNLSKGLVVKTPIAFSFLVQFAENTDTVLFGLNGTQLHKITAKGDWSGVLSDKILFDYASANCLGSGFIATWDGILSFSNDTTFKSSFSDSGTQGSGRYAVTWSAIKGCSVYNTVSGTVTVKGKLVGTVASNDRFTIHDVTGGNEPNHMLITASEKQPGGASGCIAGNCLADSPYDYEVGTTNLMPCGPTKCDGHNAVGPDGFITGKKAIYHSWANPAVPLTQLANFPNGWPDFHGSATNGATLNGPPFFMFNQQVDSPTTYPVWGYNEIVAVKSDGSLTTYRFGQTLGNTGTSPLFICKEGPGGVSPLGDYVVFTSDAGGKGALGFEADGTSRCDVFALATVATK